MQSTQDIPKKAPVYKIARKKRIRMKKIGIALTDELYSDLDNMKIQFYASSVPELIRIILTKFMEDQARLKKAEKMLAQKPPKQQK